MPLPNILGGFETLQKHFFEIFGVKEQKEKTGKNREIEISVEIFYRSPPKTEISAEISEIFFLGWNKVRLATLKVF